jgi:hypothetical protein
MTCVEREIQSNPILTLCFLPNFAFFTLKLLFSLNDLKNTKMQKLTKKLKK